MKIFSDIDKIIETVDSFAEPSFSEERNLRQNKIVPTKLDDNEILKTFSYLIAFSQNANSEIVDSVLKSGKLDKAFDGFNIDKVIKLRSSIIDFYFLIDEGQMWARKFVKPDFYNSKNGKG